jgi:hypothetical protein
MEITMNDNEIFGHIEQLVAEEQRLLEKGDPERWASTSARARSPKTVEGYLQ